MTRGAPLLSWLLVVALVLVASVAAAVDRNFAGSVQVDYLLVPTSGGNLNQGTAGPFTGGAVAPGGNGYPTNPVYFDTYGMTWRVGVKATF